MNSIVILLILLVIMLCLVLIVPSFFNEALSKIFPRILFSVKTNKKLIALSIDDSPHRKVTPEILQVLKKFNIKATFFIIGDNAHNNMDIVNDIVSDGHEIGNHLMKDVYSIWLDEEEFIHQINETEKYIPIFLNYKLFRPARGFISSRQLDILDSHNYKCCLGTLYFYDTKLSNTNLISKLILLNLRPGSIIILHDGKDERIRTVKVLETILPIIKNRGYKIATISDLINASK